VGELSLAAKSRQSTPACRDTRLSCAGPLFSRRRRTDHRGGESPETYHQILENFAAGAKTAGKDPNRLPRIIELGVDFTDDKEKAIAIRKAFWAGTFVPALFTGKIYTPKMSETNGKAVGSDTRLRQS
jgi:hypothetical protein